MEMDETREMTREEAGIKVYKRKKDRLRHYAVVGFYLDRNEQVYVGHQEATSPREAAKRAIIEEQTELRIVEVLTIEKGRIRGRLENDKPLRATALGLLPCRNCDEIFDPDNSGDNGYCDSCSGDDESEDEEEDFDAEVLADDDDDNNH